MEKSSFPRDLDDWELLDEEELEFFDLNQPKPVKNPSVPRRSEIRSRNKLVDVNYFVCPPHLILPIKIKPNHEEVTEKIMIKPDHEEVLKKEIKIKEDHGEVLKQIKIKEDHEEVLKDIKEVISHVSFRKLGESEFVDMKLDSPTSKGCKLPLMEAPKFEEEDKEKEEEERDVEEGEKKKKKRGWKIGAIWSIGVAAVTIFVFVVCGPTRQRQRQRMQFQIFADEQMAARLNQAMSAARGVPMTRAHISFGGYYDGL